MFSVETHFYHVRLHLVEKKDDRMSLPIYRLKKRPLVMVILGKSWGNPHINDLTQNNIQKCLKQSSLLTEGIHGLHMFKCKRKEII